MQLKLFHIQNFQGHKDTIIEFTPGLNVIVGPTDAGKSSILRALQKLIRDTPSGKPFLSNWATETTLTLTFTIDNQEHTIIRKVTPSKNLYYLNDAEFGGFGRVIPQEIQNTLNMSLVELESGNILDLHFFDQHDTPFMISKGSAGTRSKLLGKIVGLHVLDRAISRVNSSIREETSNLKAYTIKRIFLEDDLEDFPDLWYELEMVTALTAQIQHIETRETTLVQIQKIWSTFDMLASRIRQVRGTLKALPEISVDFRKIEKALTTFATIENVAIELHRYYNSISKIKRTFPPEIIVDFKSIEKKIMRLNILYGVYNTLVGIVEKVTDIKQNNVSEQLQKFIIEHKDILTTLGICPTCKQSIGDSLYAREKSKSS